MRLSDDKKSIELSLSGSLGAVELQTLIAKLAYLRGQMAPEVPRKPEDNDAEYTIQDDPDFRLARTRDNRFRFYVRHKGYGWIIFHLPMNTAQGMAQYVTANTPDSPDLFGIKGDDGIGMQ